MRNAVADPYARVVIDALPEGRRLKTLALQRVNVAQPDTTVIGIEHVEPRHPRARACSGPAPGQSGWPALFNPASVMKLVEVPRLPGMADTALDGLVELMQVGDGARIVEILVKRAANLIPAGALGAQYDARPLISTSGLPLHPGAAEAWRRFHG